MSLPHQTDNENRAEAIDIALSSSDFTTAKELFQEFKSVDDVAAVQYLNWLSEEDKKKLI